MPNLYSEGLSTFYKKLQDDAKARDIYDRMSNVIEFEASSKLKPLLDDLPDKEKEEYATALLHQAVLRGLLFWGRADIAAMLLAGGADVSSTDKEGMTAFHKAARAGQVEIVTLFLENNADVNSTNAEGNTPLHLAALMGQIEVVTLLLERGGADVSSRNNNQQTPLHLAAREGYQGYDEIAEQLLENDADVNSTDAEGNTPLHLAALEYPTRGKRSIHDAPESAEPVMTILLKHDADINRGNNQNKTPLSLAEPNSKAANLLMAHPRLRC